MGKTTNQYTWVVVLGECFIFQPFLRRQLQFSKQCPGSRPVPKNGRRLEHFGIQSSHFLHMTLQFYISQYIDNLSSETSYRMFLKTNCLYTMIYRTAKSYVENDLTIFRNARVVYRFWVQVLTRGIVSKTKAASVRMAEK